MTEIEDQEMAQSVKMGGSEGRNHQGEVPRQRDQDHRQESQDIRQQGQDERQQSQDVGQQDGPKFPQSPPNQGGRSRCKTFTVCGFVALLAASIPAALQVYKFKDFRDS